MDNKLSQNFNIVSFLEKKRRNQALTKDEIDYFVSLVKDSAIPDYQITAFLMAVAINGLSDQETTWLTEAMTNSGDIYVIPEKQKLGRIFVDKHSSGGIGDKVSIVLFPILACAGLYVFKASGRGLGFTGGTLDKLESIGVKVNWTFDEALQIVEKSRIMITAQTDRLAPVDKKFYALRDVTATVESIPLISSSIMSKKMAFKVDYLFLDVKYGSGAFCKTFDYAEKLARLMKSIGKMANMNVCIHISSMQQPLGYSVGNAIEVLEAQEFLSGEKEIPVLKEFIVQFAVDILVFTGVFPDAETAKKRVLEILQHAEGIGASEIWFGAQGCDLDRYRSKDYFKPKYHKDVVSKGSGYFSIIDNEKTGLISNRLGAGRVKVDDVIDFHAGIRFQKQLNDFVKEGDVLCTLYSSNPIDDSLVQEVLDNTSLTKDKVPVDPLVVLYKD